MRDRARQGGAPLVYLADHDVDWPEIDRAFVDGRWSSADGPTDDTEPAATERITLIEFMWTGLSGAQPVILVAREWLQ